LVFGAEDFDAVVADARVEVDDFFEGARLAEGRAFISLTSKSRSK